MIDRQEALLLLEKYVRNDKLIKHSLAVEAIMNEVAKILGKDTDLWRLTGLLHDLDFEYTKEDPDKHAMLTSQMIEGMLPEKGINAIKAHNYMHTDYLPSNPIDKMLIASDAVSGLIIATALVVPSKKLADVKIETLKNKFKDNSFARGCNRARIELCSDVGMELDKFLETSLRALQNISDKLNL
jgi:putative nucleotidyltransferase with HDIG domain